MPSTPQPTYAQLTAALPALDAPFDTLVLGGGARLVITQHGGRAFGPFFSDAPTATSPTWLHPSLADAAALRAHAIRDRHWNLGGDRLWLGPELTYMVRDRHNFDATHSVPAAIDPGQYTLAVDADDNVVRLVQSVTLPAYAMHPATPDGETHVRVARTFAAIDDPLARDGDGVPGVAHAGYAHTVTLDVRAPATHPLEAWSLVQLLPGGTLSTPVFGSPGVHTFFGDAPASVLATAADGGVPHLRVPITGDRRFKLGVKALSATGRMAYVFPWHDGWCALVRTYENMPSGHYTEEVPSQPGVRGFSAFVYNDDGALGGFGEMEATVAALGGPSPLLARTTSFRLHCYAGPADAIGAVLWHWLGVAA